MRKRFHTVVMLSALAMVVTSCGDNSKKDTGSGGTGGGGKPKTLGIVEFSGTDVSTQAVAAAARKAAEADGWKVVAVDAQGQPDKGNSAVENLVQRKVDGILVTVFDSNSLRAGLNAAKDAKIPVISHGGGPGDGIVASFDANGGKVVAERIAKDLNGSGALLALTYKPGLPCLQREQALDEVLKSSSGIRVTKQEIAIPGAAESASNFTTAWLTKNSSGPRAIWGCYDDPAVGAVSALKGKGVQPGAVKVYGFNNAPDAQGLIKAGYMEGSMWFDSTGAGEAEFSAVKAAVDAGSSGGTSTSKEVPAEFIDASNLDSWKSAHPNGV